MVDKKFLDNLEYKVTGACIEVHKALGSGLLESIYHKCLMRELELQGVNFTSEHLITIEYKNAFMNTEVRADLYIENCMVLELKAVEKNTAYSSSTDFNIHETFECTLRFTDKFQLHKYCSGWQKVVCQ